MPISIPTLELQAATLSVRIYRMLMDELTYEISKVTFWSDSQTTLQYIKNETKRFQTYVASRVTVSYLARPMEAFPWKG